jgi:cation transport regulator
MMECGSRSHSAEKNGMPYRSIADLPPTIREYLPPHAQEIFLEAFNHAWEEYASPSKRSSGSSLEETAMRVAWAAVKRRYVKDGNRWRPRD